MNPIDHGASMFVFKDYVVLLFIYLFIYLLFIDLFIYSFIHLFIIYLFIYSFIQLFIYYLFIYFINALTDWLMFGANLITTLRSTISNRLYS